ncbi:hypothetical protein D3875_02810 [Deinococcus cavernae]|uniref:Uncharacterized protein n=1 Tax=Deinococcus cavernae TaxID=2320857 RepID=A0A418VFR5_9DEIO|nr:hypothetical protein [Deinococcus cavernae]RJF74943.1 hypothetical protein D3875_02810 [Deinococcus cavernae]
MDATTESRPWEATPDWQHLLLFAQAEQRTRDELDDIDAVLAGPVPLDQQASWNAHAIALTRRLAQQEHDTEARATLILGQDLPPAETLAQLAREAVRTARRAVPRRTEGTAHEAPCPVGGCGLKVKDAQTRLTSHQRHVLPINPALADRPYLCPCPRQATLTVGRTARRTWVLREWKPDRDAREEINLIAQALVAGQTYADRRHSRRPDTSADATSGRLGEAGRTMISLDIRARRALLDGKVQLALEYAERAEAAHHAHQLHQRTYRRHRREDIQGGRWHNAERFYIDLPVPQGKTERQGAQRPPLHVRQVFDFLAIYDEQSGKLVVENGPEIELVSGVEVGVDGWAQLISLLSRLDPEGDKSGVKPDLGHLIYREADGHLKLRASLGRFPRALMALEALRRTLRPHHTPKVALARACPPGLNLPHLEAEPEPEGGSVDTRRTDSA